MNIKPTSYVTKASSRSWSILVSGIVSTVAKIKFYNKYRLLNVYCEIFGMISYGEGRMSLQLRLRHMNECRIFHKIRSITFLLYTFYINRLVSSVHST